MRHMELLQKHRDQIIAIAEQNHMTNVRVFGSVLHGDDTPESDIDLIADSERTLSMFDIVRAELEMSDLLGIKIDLATPKCLPVSFRSSVIAEARGI